jgi:hypothetical protein
MEEQYATPATWILETIWAGVRLIVSPAKLGLSTWLVWLSSGHINNLYNTTFWTLVQQGGMGAREAEERLSGTVSKDKNEILFKEFGINYNNEPECFRKGTIMYRDVSDQDYGVLNCNVWAATVLPHASSRDTRTFEVVQIIQTITIRRGGRRIKTYRSREHIKTHPRYRKFVYDGAASTRQSGRPAETIRANFRNLTRAAYIAGTPNVVSIASYIKFVTTPNVSFPLVHALTATFATKITTKGTGWKIPKPPPLQSREPADDAVPQQSAQQPISTQLDASFTTSHRDITTRQAPLHFADTPSALAHDTQAELKATNVPQCAEPHNTDKLFPRSTAVRLQLGFL